MAKAVNGEFGAVRKVKSNRHKKERDVKFNQVK